MKNIRLSRNQLVSLAMEEIMRMSTCHRCRMVARVRIRVRIQVRIRIRIKVMVKDTSTVTQTLMATVNQRPPHHLKFPGYQQQARQGHRLGQVQPILTLPTMEQVILMRHTEVIRPTYSTVSNARLVNKIVH